MTPTPEQDLIDTRVHDGTTLRYCSHRVPFEEACEKCVEEAELREMNRNVAT